MRRSAILKQAFRRTLTRISPVLNTRFSFYSKFHRHINLKNPTTLSEKLLKLKIYEYSNNALVKQCADKYRVRQYVEQVGCGELLNELYGVYRAPEEIDWDALPESFILKLNTASGFNHIVRDKDEVDKPALTAKIHRWFKDGAKFYLNFSELQYKDVELLILAEKLLSCANGSLPSDYRLYCFHGKCIAILVSAGRGEGRLKGAFFDSEWNYLGHPTVKEIGLTIYDHFDVLPDRPASLQQMIEAAEKLSAPFPFVRVDLYDIDGKPVFGELTFSPSSGFYVKETSVHGKNMADFL